LIAIAEQDIGTPQ